jgi:hypothetical protein
VDVAETVHGYRYVLSQDLYVAVELGPLAVQAGPRPGSDIIGDTFYTYLEAAGSPHTWVGSSM